MFRVGYEMNFGTEADDIRGRIIILKRQALLVLCPQLLPSGEMPHLENVFY